jgi:hypothetical protein
MKPAVNNRKRLAYCFHEVSIFWRGEGRTERAHMEKQIVLTGFVKLRRALHHVSRTAGGIVEKD